MFRNTDPIRRVLIALCLGIAWPAAVSAQAPAIPDENVVHGRLGPVWVKPSLALTNMGVDTNVLNQSEADGPKSDFSLTLTPAANLWLPFRLTWINGSVKEDLTWFRKYASERSASSSYALGWTVPLSRMTVWATGNWLKTRERPGFEIDARAERTEHSYQSGVEVRALSRTFFGARLERQAFDFAAGQVFLGLDLSKELKRTGTIGTLVVRHELTPLTSLTLDLGTGADRFEFAPERDADSTQMSVGLAFASDALISGSAKVGFRRFIPQAADVPDFKGATTNVSLSYAARETTRFSLLASRDVQYSFDSTQPYYLLAGFTAVAQQRLFGPFDLEGRLGRQRLSYRDRAGVVVAVLGRVDHAQTYGGGLGFHVGSDLRLAFNLEHQRRLSEVANRNYSGLRIGMTATYGL